MHGVTRRGTLLFGWTLALLAIAGFTRLGAWQYGRMHEKAAMLASAADVLANKRPVPLGGDASPGFPAWVDGQARVLAPTLLLDNQMREGRAGVRVFCLVDVQGVARLVDFGWVEMPRDRTPPQAATCRPGATHVRGLLTAPPSSGVAMGPALQSVASGRWLMTRVDDDAIRTATGIALPWPHVVRLDPALPGGYARDLDILPNTLPPERHLGYAVQWWALAFAVLVTALVLTFRKRKPRA